MDNCRVIHRLRAVIHRPVDNSVCLKATDLFSNFIRMFVLCLLFLEQFFTLQYKAFADFFELSTGWAFPYYYY